MNPRIVYVDPHLEIQLVIEPGQHNENVTFEMEDSTVKKVRSALDHEVPQHDWSDCEVISNRPNFIRQSTDLKEVALCNGSVHVKLLAVAKKKFPKAELSNLLSWGLAEAEQAIREADIDQLQNADFDPITDPDLDSPEA